MLDRLKKSLLGYSSIFRLLILFLLIGAIFRVVLLVLYADVFNIDVIISLLIGIKMDIMVFSSAMLLSIWFYVFNLIIITRYILLVYFSIYFVLEFTTITYFNTFYTRPNYLIIEHFSNPVEVLVMTFKMYPFYIVVAVFAVYFIIKYFYYYLKTNIVKTPILQKLYLFPIVVFLILLGIRQSFDHSTPNQSNYTFSNNTIYNEIANSTFFSIGYDMYLRDRSKMYNYGKYSKDSFDDILNIQHLMGDLNFKTKNRLIRDVKSNFNHEKFNIILIMLESFGHAKVGHLGGIDTTPNLDKIAKNGIYFTNLYAVGPRTNWGISSILTSLYPNPNSSYLQLLKSKNDFYTIAKTLKQNGYKNIFLYAGDANFDNMSGFMVANGYDKIYDKNKL